MHRRTKKSLQISQTRAKRLNLQDNFAEKTVFQLMKKLLRIIISTISWLIVSAVSLPILVGLLLQIGPVQNLTVSYLTDWLTERSGTRFEISRVDISFFNKASFEGVFVEDPTTRDTMLYVDNLKVGIKGINFITGEISLGTVSLTDGQMTLAKDSAGIMNVKRVTDCFKSANPRTSSSDFMLHATELNMINFAFRYKIYQPRIQPHGVNFQDMQLHSIHFQAHGVEVLNDDVHLSIEHLSFAEQSGFNLQHLNSRTVVVNSTGLRFGELQLETQKSLLRLHHLDFLYDNWSAYNDFVHQVRLDADIQPSTLAYRTISYFTRRPPSDIPTSILFSGRVTGPICDLRGEIPSLKTSYTMLNASFHISGLPDLATTTFDVQLQNLLTDAEDILSIYNDMTGKDLEKLRPILTRCGPIHFSGDFNGMLSEFNTTGRLAIRQGAVEGNLKFRSNKNTNRFTGHVATSNFDLGSMLGASPTMGRLSAEVDIDATGSGNSSMEIQTKGSVTAFEYNGYRYNSITLDGRFAGRAFNGHVQSNDPNLSFTTDGHFDFNNDVPYYNFEMDLQHADLFALKFNTTDSTSILSSAFSAHLTGNNIDNINGNCTIQRLNYHNHVDTVKAGQIVFEAQNSDQAKSLTMRSDFADIDLRGRNSYANMFRFLSQSLRRYLPSIPEIEEIAMPGKQSRSALLRNPKKLAAGKALPPSEVASNDGYYMLQINVKQANNVASIFVPGLEIAQNSRLTFLFNPSIDQFSLSAKSDYILRRDMYIDSLIIESRNWEDSVSLYLGARSIGIGSFDMPDFSILGGIKNNRIALGTRFSNPETGYEALLNTTSTITRTPQGLPQLNIGIHSTNLLLDNHRLYLAPSNIIIDTTGFEFRKFMLWGEGQAIDINGRASALESDTLKIGFKRVDLSPVSQFVSRLGYKINGRLSGTAQFVAPLGEMQFSAGMAFDSLGLNEHDFGHVDFQSEWDPARQWVSFFVMQPDGTKPVTGVYDSRGKRYRADFNFPNLDMSLLEPLLQGIMTDTRGTADAKLVLTGTAKTPTINGTVDVKEYEATIEFTRARYHLSGPVKVTNNRFELTDAPISDGEKGKGRISAWFDSQYFKNLTYNVHADFTDLLALNTTIQDNPIYYGQAYGTGSFEVGGDERNTLIDVKAETALDSRFVLPISQVSTISEADFITFVRPPAPPTESRISRFHRERATKTRFKAKSNLEVSLALNVLPNTEARIVMNERFGDEIRGRGNGRFRMSIIPNRDIFTMNGQYEVSEGKYLFTFLGAVANKLFTIQPGGTISWRGDPADPQINLSAAYKVRTSLAPLEGVAQVGQNSGSIAVNCDIHLTGQLLSPDIGLALTAPSATPETQNLLRNTVNTQESTMQQFIYLLAFGGFMPDTNTAGGIGTMSGSLAGIAGMEFLSNQISNMISSDKYRLSLGYRPQSDISSEEVTFGLSANIVDNLSVEVGGNYDVNRNAATTVSSNPLSVDANLTWVLNKAGSLKIKGFTRTIDRFDESQGLQDNGVGIAYRQEFQNWRDLQARYRAWMLRIKANKAQREEKKENKKTKK